MKTKLKFTNDELIAANKLLQKLYDLPFNQFESTQKIFVSIGLDLADKFDKKCKSIIKKANLFEQEKKHDTTLKFHEAWALKNICVELFSWSENEYQKTQLQNIINKLDKWTK